ncbi:MAG: DEAD/DEAH box helicase [Planctomycetes bacterium]|nr:DEAD/DEAH box helicase [Planctomycetota bacterium]
MTTSTSGPARLKPGQLVRVRSRQYIVEEVVPPPAPGEQTLVRLACLDDDAQGAELSVLWESEVDAKPLGATSWKDVARRGFDPAHIFAAYLHTLRWNCVTATNPKLFQAPYRAGIEVMAYQLEPLRKALLLPRVNLFIADDVGLGKTIEAGLILRELLLRQKVRRMVVACPPSIVLQWRDELERRFGLTFVVYDREYVLARRRERGYGINPWTTHTRFIISHALLRDEDYAAPLRDWLGDFPAGAILILDEAHNAAPASASKYAIDSQFTRIVRELAPRFEHRLFLSATPHNGHSNSFAALLEILDPQRFCRGVPVRGAKLLDAVMVRRLKEDLRTRVGGFPERQVVQLDIDGLPLDAPELRLSRLLQEYIDLREGRLGSAAKSAQRAAGLLHTTLQKRLLSSIRAFARTLRVHRQAVERHLAGAGLSVRPFARRSEEVWALQQAPGADDAHSELSDAELETEEDRQLVATTHESTVAFAEEGGKGSHGKELKLLGDMLDLAEAARDLPDPRVRILVDWIAEHMCPGLLPSGKSARPGTAPAWNNRRLLIFTEYVDTKRYLEDQLRAAIAGSDDAERRIETFHGQGGMDEKKREEIKRAFNGDPARHPLRILIATDAAREGVNLQNYCADLFHFDVPWNPARIEQRNGRIDRKLQRSPEVRCHYFVFRQRPEDPVLAALIKKTKTIALELGSLGPVLEGRLAAMLERGIRHRQTQTLIRDIEAAEVDRATRRAVEEELEATRVRQEALERQLDTLRELKEESERHLGLQKEALCNALSCSLELLGAEPLRPRPDPDGGKQEQWTFPALDRRSGADPTWAETLDTLRPARERDQKLLEWRKAAPIQPVVFSDAGTLDDDRVHLHLEHRVVRRLLGRFLSQGFVHNDLSRACVGQTTDSIPRVILLGRLALYGERAARLHDELVAVTARWVEPTLRKGALRPYAHEAEDRTHDLLERSLTEAGRKGVPSEVQARLRKSVERDVEELLPHLAPRAEEAAGTAAAELRARGDREAKNMTEILESQRTRIRQTQEASIARYDATQLRLVFAKDEVRQIEADRRHWEKRLAAIERELVDEPVRVRGVYVVKVTRVEPVGIVYLWPVSG